MIGMDDNGMNEIEQAKQSTIRGIVEDFFKSDEGRAYAREIIKENRNR